VELTYKETLFVNAYLGEANGNGSEAARIAGYHHPGQLAYRLLQKRSIRTAIAARVTEAAMPANEVLARISEFASADMGNFLDIDKKSGAWNVNLVKARRAGKTKLVKKIKATKDGTEIELHSPLDALDKLARYHGFYTEKIKIEATQNVSKARQFLDDDPPKTKEKTKPKRKAP